MFSICCFHGVLLLIKESVLLTRVFMLCFFERLSEDRGRSLVGAILSKVVPAAASTIASFSKLIWRSNDQSPKRKPEAKTQSFARGRFHASLIPSIFENPSMALNLCQNVGAASSLTCIKDYPRKGEKLMLSPSGTLAAITDSLGRILLLDTQALVVVRLWKVCFNIINTLLLRLNFHSIIILKPKFLC